MASGGGGGEGPAAEQAARRALSWLGTSKPQKFALALAGIWALSAGAFLLTARTPQPQQPAGAAAEAAAPQPREERLAALQERQEQLARQQMEREVRCCQV